MDIEVRTSGGTCIMPLETKLFTGRMIFINGDITRAMADEFVQKILYLNTADPEAPIKILVDSPGGEVNSGMIMYDAIQASTAPVIMVCTGMAYSMAALLFASGNHGRYILPHGSVMIHEPFIQDAMRANATSIKYISDSLTNIQKMQTEILVKHTGKTEEEINKAVTDSRTFDAKESVEFGLSDEVISFDRIMQL